MTMRCLIYRDRHFPDDSHLRHYTRPTLVRRRQAIIWSYVDFMLTWPLGSWVNEIWIEILRFSYMNINLKTSSGKWRPLCLVLNLVNLKTVLSSFTLWREELGTGTARGCSLQLKLQIANTFGPTSINMFWTLMYRIDVYSMTLHRPQSICASCRYAKVYVMASINIHLHAMLYRFS